MSSEEPAKPRNIRPKPEPKTLDGGIVPDVAHIAGLLGPEDFEPPAALSPRPAGIREDVRVLAVTLFESAKAETEAVTSASSTQGTRLKESPVAPAVDGPPAIDEPLPGLEEVRMQEQLIERATISPISKDDLTLATTREEPIITEPLPGLEEDVKMQEQSVLNISTLSRGVEIPTRLLHHGASTEHQLRLTSSQEPKDVKTETAAKILNCDTQMEIQQPHINASIGATALTQFLPAMTTDASQERALSSDDESSDSSDSSTDISSSSESSDSSSESPAPDLGAILAQISDGDSDNDSAVNRKTRKAGEIPATVHEILAPQVILPSITSVEPSETIELIGEVLSIIDSVVVVKSYEHGQYKVLDTDSLFVLEDRKVLGLVFETFGPLTQPLYSLRFPSAPDLRARHPDISPGTKVYYCPSRSTFAYTSAIRLQKGNDASNIYDEEVGEDELDFSDDEKETEWKRRKGKGRGRTSSIASSSRGITPLPLMREGSDDISVQDMYGASPYDEPQPGRTVVDYRDPYADDTTDDGASESGRTMNVDPSHAPRGRRGRGRGRGRGRDHRLHGSGNHSTRRPYGSMAAPNAPLPQPLSPTSLHIARVTSMTPSAPNQTSQPQFGYQPHYPQYQSQQQQYDPRQYMESGGETSVGMVPAPFNFNFGGSAPVWAPTPMQNSGDGNGHINPRFFGQFGDVNPGPGFFGGAPSGGHQQ